MKKSTVSTTHVPDIWEAMYASIMARQTHPTGTRRRKREIKENKEDAERYRQQVMLIRNGPPREIDMAKFFECVKLHSVGLITTFEALGNTFIEVAEQIGDAYDTIK